MRFMIIILLILEKYLDLKDVWKLKYELAYYSIISSILKK